MPVFNCVLFDPDDCNLIQANQKAPHFDTFSFFLSISPSFSISLFLPKIIEYFCTYRLTIRKKF